MFSPGPVISPATSILSFVKEVMKLDDVKKTLLKGNAYVLYSNGKVTYQQGGNLLWNGPEFIHLPPISLAPIVRFKPEDRLKDHVYITVEEGNKLHSALRKIYGIPDELKYSVNQMSHGFTLEEIYQASLLPKNAGISTDKIYISAAQLRSNEQDFWRYYMIRQGGPNTPKEDSQKPATGIPNLFPEDDDEETQRRIREEEAKMCQAQVKASRSRRLDAQLDWIRMTVKGPRAGPTKKSPIAVRTLSFSKKAKDQSIAKPAIAAKQ